jgi:predicted MFS family arabinose efflux permease
MTKEKTSNKPAAAETASWLALGVIVLAQMQMAFNVNAIPVSIGPIVDDLETSATAVGTALVVYSLFVAAFVMLGAKLGKMIGAKLVFQVTVLLHGAAMVIMALANDASDINTAQALAGLAAALLVPTLVVLIAANYHGSQQAQAFGILAGSPAIAGALAFFVAGFLGTALSWRWSFGLLAVVAAVVFVLSFRLEAVPRQKGVRIDFVGAGQAAAAIMLIMLGFNNLNNWGVLLAKPDAPFTILGLSPAPLAILLGLMFAQAFFVWAHRRVEQRKTPLVALEVLDSRPERAAMITLLIVGAVGPAVNFLIPLYIQIVQDQTSLFTAVAVVPYTLAIGAAAMLSVRLYSRFTPRVIAVIAFSTVAAGLIFLAYTIRGEWGTPTVVLALILTGFGEGTLITLLFNVLVSASPKALAGDVGAWRGVANNLSTGLGTAFAGLAAVSLLSMFVLSSLAASTIPQSLKVQVNLDQIDFISNPQLETVLSETTATPKQVAEAVAINAEARLQALKVSFLILAGFSLLAIFPAMGLPAYRPGEVPAEGTSLKDRFRRKKKPAPVES